MYTYLLLNIFTLLFPFILSFDKKVKFYQRWPALIPAIAISAAIFIIWDVWFTAQGVWKFNPDYLVGIYALGLPLEEWLFFITVPYACVFIYECIRIYFPNTLLVDKNQYFLWGFVLLLTLIGVSMYDRLYTFITFISLAAFLMFHLLILQTNYFHFFFRAYAIHLVPFFIINGILTALPVVIYNNQENLGIRIWTVPVEDTMYSMLLLLLTITYYERFLAKGLGKRPDIYYEGKYE